MNKISKIIVVFTLLIAFSACQSEDMKVQKAYEEGKKEVLDVQQATEREVAKEQIKADKIKRDAIKDVQDANTKLEDTNAQAHIKIDESGKQLNEKKEDAERQIIEAVTEANENVVEARE